MANRLCGETTLARGDCLVQDRERIAHGAIAGFGEQRQRIIIGRNVLPSGKLLELPQDLLKSYRSEAEMLAARADGLRDVLRLRRRQHEHDMTGRLLERLQQSIKCGVGNLMGFV